MSRSIFSQYQLAILEINEIRIVVALEESLNGKRCPFGMARAKIVKCEIPIGIQASPRPFDTWFRRPPVLSATTL